MPPGSLALPPAHTAAVFLTGGLLLAWTLVLLTALLWKEQRQGLLAVAAVLAWVTAALAWGAGSAAGVGTPDAAGAWVEYHTRAATGFRNALTFLALAQTAPLLGPLLVKKEVPEAAWPAILGALLLVQASSGVLAFLAFKSGSTLTAQRREATAAVRVEPSEEDRERLRAILREQLSRIRSKRLAPEGS